MDHPSLQHRAHLALPFAVMGLLGALLTADYYRLGLHGEGRGPLVLMLPPAGAVLGIALSARAVAARRWLTWLVATLGTTAVGWGVSVCFSAIVYPGLHPATTVREGILTSFAFIPFVALTTYLARRVGRARAGSMVDEADRRAPWVVIAAGVAAVEPIVRYSDGSDWALHGTTEVASALGCLATGALVAVLVAEIAATIRAHRYFLAVMSMRPRDPSHDADGVDVIDLGLGDDEHEASTETGSAYRTNARPVRVIRGNPAEVLAALHRTAIRTGVCLAFALLGVVSAQGLR